MLPQNTKQLCLPPLHVLLNKEAGFAGGRSQTQRGSPRLNVCSNMREKTSQRIFFNEYQPTCSSKETMGDQNFILFRRTDAVIIISQDNGFSVPASPCLSILAQQFDMKSANGKRWQWTTFVKLGWVSSHVEMIYFLHA